jgi:hypothetical protein
MANDPSSDQLPAIANSNWYLYVPYSAPTLRFTDPLTERVSGYEILFQRTGDRYGGIEVKDLASIEDAQSVFAALKRGALAASLNLSTGIRIKDELVILYETDDPAPEDEGQPFACRQGRNLARMFIVFGEAQFQIPKVRERLRQSLVVGFDHVRVQEALANPRIALACRLFIDSQFEASDEARMLSLIGVLEVLKDQEASSADAQRLVEKWIQESTWLDTVEASSFRSTLKFMKSISISRGIRSVVERHLGAERARDAQKLYSARTALVHEGKRPHDLGNAVRQTESIARDLLIGILTTNRCADGNQS